MIARLAVVGMIFDIHFSLAAILEQHLAAADQDEDVAGMGGAVTANLLVEDGVAALQDGGGLGGDRLGQAAVGAALAFRIDRRLPGLALLAGQLAGQGPQVDAAGAVLAERLVADQVEPGRRRHRQTLIEDGNLSRFDNTVAPVVVMPERHSK